MSRMAKSMEVPFPPNLPAVELEAWSKGVGSALSWQMVREQGGNRETLEASCEWDVPGRQVLVRVTMEQVGA